MVIGFLSCCGCHKTSKSAQPPAQENKPQAVTGATKALPPVYIYKMKNDYSRNVPVILSPDKNDIVSFPSVKDVWAGEVLAYPLELEHGYFLDVRGITENAAFLSYTYEEYAALEKTPTPQDLNAKLIATDPFESFYYCGKKNEYKELMPELNTLITEGKLDTRCKRIK